MTAGTPRPGATPSHDDAPQPAPLRLVALTGGISLPSTTRTLSDLLVERAVAHLEADGRRVEVRTVEARDVAEDATTAMVLGLRTPALVDALRAVEEADLLVVTTPVFRGSYSGILKTVVDLLDADALAGTPVLLGATGGSPRHTLVIDQALRPLLAFLGAVSVPVGVYASTGDWSPERYAAPWLEERADRAARGLADLAALVAPPAAPSAAAPAEPAAPPAAPATALPEAAPEDAVTARPAAEVWRG